MGQSSLSCTEKVDVMVVENNERELVPTLIQSGWRICIDYRKLNAVIRKYHFLLSFINQMLERHAEKSQYCCLERFSRFHQIPVAPEDHDKKNVYLPIRIVRLPTHAIWILQRTSHLSKVYVSFLNMSKKKP